MTSHLTTSILVLALLFQCKTAQITKTPSRLENTHWRLMEMNGNPIFTLDGSRDVHFIISAKGSEKKVSGFAGCNSLGGSYTLSGNKLKFVIVSTKMMCSAEQMVVEDFLLTALTSASTYKIEGDVLKLFDGETSLAEFRATESK